VPKLAALLRRLRVDVVHAYLFDAEIAVRLAGRLAGTPLVAGSERNANYSLKRIQRLAYALTRRSVDLIVANSSAGADFHRRTIGHDASAYRVIRNAVDTDRFVPRSRLEARRRLSLADDEPIVGMFASFKRQKNHPLLLAAAPSLLAQVPRLRLLLVGDELYAGMHGSSEYKTRVTAMIDDLGLRDRCITLGNRDDVELLYPACDVTVLPSLFEGTPNVALESMACGVPVVCTDVSDNAIVVPDGKVGFVVPLGDSEALAERLARLLTDSRLREAMGRAAREWTVSEFSPTRLAENTVAAYRERLRRS
jgi:glycosyltransferase involved in cell wall biosynthesis